MFTCVGFSNSALTPVSRTLTPPLLLFINKLHPYLIARDETLFYEKIEYFFAALLIAVPVSVYYRFLREKLSLYWREALSNKVLDKCVIYIYIHLTEHLTYLHSHLLPFSLFCLFSHFQSMLVCCCDQATPNTPLHTTNHSTCILIYPPNPPLSLYIITTTKHTKHTKQTQVLRR